MKRKLILTFISVLMATHVFAVDTTTLFNDPNITRGEKNVYTFNIDKTKSHKIARYLDDLKDGFLVKRSTDQVELVKIDGKDYYKLVTANELVNGNKWVQTFFISRKEGNKMAPSKMVYEHFNKNKEQFDKREFNFDVGFRDHPPGTVPMFLGAFFLRGVDLKPGSRKAFDLWIDNGIIFRIWADVIKTESVTVPAGTFKCIQLDVYPDLDTILGKVFSKFLKPFMKPWQMWVAEDDSHFMVKVIGTPGPPGTPMITINLVKHQQL